MKISQNFRLQQSRRGFTLIELLIVMAIIATLAGISAPIVLTKLDEAKQTKSENIARQLEIAIDGFHQDYYKLPSPEAEYPSADNIRKPYRAQKKDPLGSSMLRILANQETTEDIVNHKGVEYYTPEEGKASSDTGAIGGASRDSSGNITGLYDSYGQPFHIIFNFDHDSGTDVPKITSTKSKPEIQKLSGKDSAVFSAGKDRKILSRDDVKTW